MDFGRAVIAVAPELDAVGIRQLDHIVKRARGFGRGYLPAFKADGARAAFIQPAHKSGQIVTHVARGKLRSAAGVNASSIAFITHSADIRQILDHIGAESEPPRLSAARGPPLWQDCGDAQVGNGVQIEPDWATDWDGAAQPAPDIEVDQRVNW